MIPRPSKTNLLQPDAGEALPRILKTVSSEQYVINLRSGFDTLYQLEWINKAVLTRPTAVIYTLKPGMKSIRDAELVGRIEARGTYRFKLRSDISNDRLLLYDFIHQEIIDTINF